MGVHDGHRERLRSSFLEYGLNPISDVNALELLLFYAIPRKDTNPLAHALLERFGSIQAVFSASEQELCEIPGISRSTAALIRLVPELGRRSRLRAAEDIQYIRTSQEAGAYLVPQFANIRDELALILCLDSGKRIIRCQELGRGEANTVHFSIRRLVEYAVQNKAAYVILSHNHPEGFALPSREDDQVTQQVYEALRTIGVELFDHIIVAQDDFVSYRDSGWLRMPGETN